MVHRWISQRHKPLWIIPETIKISKISSWKLKTMFLSSGKAKERGAWRELCKKGTWNALFFDRCCKGKARLLWLKACVRGQWSKPMLLPSCGKAPFLGRRSWKSCSRMLYNQEMHKVQNLQTDQASRLYWYFLFMKRIHKFLTASSHHVMAQ